MTDQDFIAGADHLIDRLRHALAGLGSAGTGMIPDKLGRPVRPEPSRLPVLAQVDALADHAPPACAEAVRALRAITPVLAWRQTYRSPAVTEAFLYNYGWTELVGETAPYRTGAVSIGLLLLGPHTHYPTHQHEAFEQYVPLSGEAAWFDEDSGWRGIPPLSVITHRPWVKHAMRTGAAPLLAFYRWSGAGAQGRARLAVD